MREDLFVVDEHTVGREQVDDPPGVVRKDQPCVLRRHTGFFDAEVADAGPAYGEAIARELEDRAGLLAVRVAGQEYKACKLTLAVDRRAFVENIRDLVPRENLRSLWAGSTGVLFRVYALAFHVYLGLLPQELSSEYSNAFRVMHLGTCGAGAGHG